MPKKPNRKELQNYIGAGNGDKSGEYTFDKGGGGSSGGEDNPPIKAVPPKKEEPPKATEPQINDAVIETPPNTEEDVPKSTNKGERYKDVNNYVNEKDHSTYSKAQKEYINNFTKDCDDTCNSLIAEAQEKSRVFYRIGKGVCSYGYNWFTGEKGGFQIRLDKKSLQEGAENDDYGMGTVFYHENGHLVDAMKKEGSYSSDYISKKYNMTLSDMIKQELDERGQDIYSELKEKRESMIREANSSAPQEEVDAFRKASRVIADLNYKHLTETLEIKKKELGENFSYKDLAKWEATRGKEIEDTYSNSSEYKKAKSDYDAHKDPRIELENNAKKKFNRDYGDISDMLDSVGLGITMGHGSSYWRKSSHRGDEFFAEAFKTKATQNGKLLEYFPKTAEIFEEIIKEISKK